MSASNAGWLSSVLGLAQTRDEALAEAAEAKALAEKSALDSLLEGVVDGVLGWVTGSSDARTAYSITAIGLSTARDVAVRSAFAAFDLASIERGATAERQAVTANKDRIISEAQAYRDQIANSTQRTSTPPAGPAFVFPGFEQIQAENRARDRSNTLAEWGVTALRIWIASVDASGVLNASTTTTTAAAIGATGPGTSSSGTPGSGGTPAGPSTPPPSGDPANNIRLDPSLSFDDNGFLVRVTATDEDVANANVAENRRFSYELRINTQTRESLTFQQHVERSLAPPGHPAHLDGYFSLNPEMQAFLVSLHEANLRPGNLNDNFDYIQALLPWATFVAVEGGTIATGLDTLRDAGEALSGYDIYGNPLTPGERAITVAAMLIPGVPASVGRGVLGLVYAKADDALGAAGDALKSNVGTALNAVQKADDDIAKAGAKVDAAADKLDDAGTSGTDAATIIELVRGSRAREILVSKLGVHSYPVDASAQAHHIFGVELFDTRLGKRLQEWGIDLNGPANGVWLPSRDYAGRVASIHRGRTAGAYSHEVMRRLEEATNKADATSILDELRDDLKNGRLLINGAE